MPTAEQISLDQAKSDKLFYIVVNVVVYRESDQRCLILQRHPQEKVHPGKFAVPGGKLEWSDLNLNRPTRVNGDVLDYEGAVEKLIEREVAEEAGIEIEEKLHFINDVAYIRPDGIPVLLVKFAAKYKGGVVVLEEGAFTDYAWVNAEEVKRYPCIDGIHAEVAQVIDLYAALCNDQEEAVKQEKI